MVFAALDAAGAAIPDKRGMVPAARVGVRDPPRNFVSHCSCAWVHVARPTATSAMNSVFPGRLLRQLALRNVGALRSAEPCQMS